MILTRSQEGVGAINTRHHVTIRDLQFNTQLPCAKPLKHLKIFLFSFFHQHIFSLDKQHCVEADWLSIQVSVEKDFWILVGRGHLISLLGEVRCYQVTTFGTLKAEFDIELRITSSLVFRLENLKVEIYSFLGRNRKIKKSAAHSTQHQQILLLGRRVGMPRINRMI